MKGGRDKEELVFGLAILLLVPILLGVAPQFLVYALFLGAFVLMGWLTMLGLGIALRLVGWAWNRIMGALS